MSEKTWSCSPFASIDGIKILVLDEVELDEYVQDDDLKLVLKEDLRCFAALALGLLQEDVPR